MCHAAPLPPEIEPLVLWEPAEGVEGDRVEVDPMLTAFLRPHQREGVQFMFECVAGLKDFDGQGEFLSEPWLERPGKSERAMWACFYEEVGRELRMLAAENHLPCLLREGGQTATPRLVMWGWKAG